MKRPIRVLIVEDSPFKQDALEAMLVTDPDIKVVGGAKDGIEAIEMVKELRPSVITMDLKMPRMDGPEAIKNIMAKTPTPIIVVSVTVENQMKFTFKCLELGALDFVPVMYDTERMAQELIDKVKIASQVKVIRHVRPEVVRRVAPVKRKAVTTKIVAIASSTGGPQALEEILPCFSADFPAGIVVIQHIAERFSRELAVWLDKKSKITVKEAEDGDRIKPGVALIAPGDRHLVVKEDGSVKLSKEPGDLVNIPSADVAFESIARVYGPKALGIIMTGMGCDGAKGMAAIKAGGGGTIAQDEESSMIFGMNGAAIENGCIDRVVPLTDIVDTVVNMMGGDEDAEEKDIDR